MINLKKSKKIVNKAISELTQESFDKWHKTMKKDKIIEILDDKCSLEIINGVEYYPRLQVIFAMNELKKQLKKRKK